MNPKHPKYIGIFLGVAYGLSVRVMWELEALQDFGGLVTLSFVFLVPFIIGFIRIHFECYVDNNLSYGKMVRIAWEPIFIFALASVLTLLEGSICVAMALPAFMFFSSLGGLAAGSLHKFVSNKKSGNLLSVALLPLLIAPIEVNFLELSKTYQVENSIIIDASPELVWRQLSNVSTIENSELPFSLTSFIGVPSPIEANMNGSGVGAVRTSKWEKGVEFKEVITAWVPNQRMAYLFDIDPTLIPDHALDKHVKLGGEYFSPLEGEYLITTNSEGQTVLHLNTTLIDNTNFGFYSRVWGEIIFQDFHMTLLSLMKTRAENLPVAQQ